ncbi:hypothetical protein FRC00_011713 [Tulasnella sp. 408]|nr:hypothetical protein FRC00_011713 [Tulasnella sp. 408]
MDVDPTSTEVTNNGLNLRSFWGIRSPPPPSSLPPLSFRGRSNPILAPLPTPSAGLVGGFDLPATSAYAAAHTDQADHAEEVAIFAAVGECKSVEDFAALVPEPYRDTAKAFLLKIRTNLQRAEDLSKRAAALAKAVSDGDPSLIPELAGFRAPAYQWPKAFPKGQEYSDSLKTRSKAFVASCADILLEAAQDELALTESAVSEGVVAAFIADTLHPIFKATAKKKWLGFTKGSGGKLISKTLDDDNSPAHANFVRACSCPICRALLSIASSPAVPHPS